MPRYLLLTVILLFALVSCSLPGGRVTRRYGFEKVKVKSMPHTHVAKNLSESLNITPRHIHQIGSVADVLLKAKPLVFLQNVKHPAPGTYVRHPDNHAAAAGISFSLQDTAPIPPPANGNNTYKKLRHYAILSFVLGVFTLGATIYFPGLLPIGMTLLFGSVELYLIALLLRRHQRIKANAPKEKGNTRGSFMRRKFNRSWGRMIIVAYILLWAVLITIIYVQPAAIFIFLIAGILLFAPPSARYKDHALKDGERGSNYFGIISLVCAVLVAIALLVMFLVGPLFIAAFYLLWMSTALALGSALISLILNGHNQLPLWSVLIVVLSYFISIFAYFGIYMH